ncbi:MAG: thiamine phosphate synthase [Desulfonatronovibrionaceae bacterium]
MKTADYSLYLVTDQDLCRGRDLVDTVMEAVAGGVTAVQIREKNASARAFFQLALALKKRLAKQDVPLIINDRVDVAVAADADGVHVGQTDLPAAQVREMIGPDKILGISINTFEQMEEAARNQVDYLSLSPVFPTPTKTDTTEPFGISGLKKARTLTRLPLITIGGVNLENIHEIMSTGLDGVALVSAICSADSPEQAARTLAEKIRQARELRASGD